MTPSTLITTLGAFIAASCIKVIFLALTTSGDSNEDNYGVFLKHGSSLVDLAVIMMLIKQPSLATGVKQDTLFCLSLGWSFTEAVATNALKIVISDSGEELELKDLFDAFSNIFQMVDWICIFGLIMVYTSNKKTENTSYSRRSNSKTLKSVDKKGNNETEAPKPAQSNNFLIALVLLKLVVLP